METQHLGDVADVADALQIFRRGDGSLDQREVVGSFLDDAGHFQEVGDVDLADD